MCSTNFGEQLSAESLELIKAVRHELTEQIPTNVLFIYS
jgi:hypothetical protein